MTEREWTADELVGLGKVYAANLHVFAQPHEKNLHEAADTLTALVAALEFSEREKGELRDELTHTYKGMDAAREEIERITALVSTLADALRPFVDERHVQREGSSLCDWCGFNWPCNTATAASVLGLVPEEGPK